MYPNFNNKRLPSYSGSLAAPLDCSLGSWLTRAIAKRQVAPRTNVIIPRTVAPRRSWLKATIGRSAYITSPRQRPTIRPTKSWFRAIRNRALEGTTPIEELSGLSGDALGVWYDDLLQVGTSLFTKYQSYTDIKKQKKAAAEYSALLAEQERLRAIQQTQAQMKSGATTATGPKVTTVGGIDVTYLLLGGIGIGAVLLLRK